ncbi:MAG: tyrosine-type recombinase/integrase [bacterium]|nr:tyrosine-type recombinase/integrase [bacterium]
MAFIRFLERTGHVETPGELDDNLRLLAVFLAGLRNHGYAVSTIVRYRQACTGLIVWLHLSRIRLSDLTWGVCVRFLNRQFICSIPRVFCDRATRPSGSVYYTELRGFMKHLAATGRIAPAEPASIVPAPPARLQRYAVWLERHRGIGEGSIRRHVRLIAGMMSELGDDPGVYDAALIRRVLLAKMQPWSPSYAKTLASVMRMYLRFLAAEGSVPGALVAAVPPVPRWQLSDLPRHTPAEDVERAIACCGDHPTGVRDRAILLLLARLALRAGDIVALRLGDIDWDRAEIRVSGKSRHEAVLPLPQDAGDALHAYIATVRPRVDEEKVFLCIQAPWRALTESSIVSSLASRALDRAGVKTFASRGAHVFRHSQATSLLRSGATLDVVQALLRHASPNTTMIYAKTDAVMLQEVAQPWIGRTDR